MIYDIPNKTFIGWKPLWIRFDKIDGIIRIDDGTRYLFNIVWHKNVTLFTTEVDVISLKSGIIYIFSHYVRKIKVASYDSLRIEKTLTLHVLILIESVLKKDKNYYYYKIFLEKFPSIK